MHDSEAWRATGKNEKEFGKDWGEGEMAEGKAVES